MSKQPTWETTSVQSLLRNRSSGRYYGRWTLTVNGKSVQRWKSLGTDVFTVAKLRVADESAKVERQRGTRAAVAAGSGAVGDLMTAYTDRVRADTELRPASIAARLVALKKIEKTWPELATMKPGGVTTAAVAAWAARFKAEGTAYTPPGAKTVLRGNSATSVNRAVDTLRRIFDLAVEQGATHANPVTMAHGGARLKKKIVAKKLTLPSKPDVHRLFTAMENNGAPGGWGIEAADLCRFLSFSGSRIGEVPGVTWSDVDWDRNQLRIRGQKTATSDRVVPLFADLAALLRKVIERRKRAAVYAEGGKPMIEPADRIFRLSECQKSIDAACKRLGIARVTHHDFRHLFATCAIESGVDIPSVSRWLGHSDGGALAMRTYGHLRQEHSQAQAAKVNFGA